MSSTLPKLLFNHRKGLAWAFVLTFAVIPLFVNLGELPLRTYDESRLANNAYEMLKSGEFWITTYDATPDLWNTKPPLLIWIHLGFIKLFGFNEIALRLPSAIAALIICLTLIRFFKKYLDNIYYGFLSVIVLVSSSGFVCLHGTRTGDYDSMLALFMLVYSLCFFLYIELKSIPYIYAFGLFLGLSVLTKSVAGLLFLPGLGIYLIYSKHFLSALRDKHIYVSCVFAVSIFLPYYFYRESLSPGYFEAIKLNELGGRYFETIEVHSHPFSYYYDNIRNFHFNHWFILMVIGIAIGLNNNDIRISRISRFSISIILSYFFIISCSKTKLEWYAIPMYPFMAIFTAIALHKIISILKDLYISRSYLGFEIIPILFLVATVYEPYRKILKSTFFPLEKNYETEYYQISYFLKDAIKGQYDLNGYLLTDVDYHPQTKAYVYMLNEKGVNIKEHDYFDLKNNDIAIVHQDSVKNYIHKTYIFEKDIIFKNIAFYKIKGHKYAH